MGFGGATGAVAEDGKVGVVMVDLVVLGRAVGMSEEGDTKADVAVVGLRIVGCGRHRESSVEWPRDPKKEWCSVELRKGRLSSSF